MIAVVSSAERGELARAAGADTVRLADEEWERDERADVVVDPVGGEAFRRALRCLSPGGRLLVVGFASGTIPELKVNRLLLGHTDVVGVNYGGMLMVDQAFALSGVGGPRPLVHRGPPARPRDLRAPARRCARRPHALGEHRMTGKPVAAVR